jgi:hypothetical protein
MKVIKEVIDWLKEGQEPATTGMGKNFSNEENVYALTASDNRRNYELRYIPKAYSGRMLCNVSSELLLGISVLTVFFVMMTFGMV